MRRLLGIGASVLLVLWLGAAFFGSTNDSTDDSQEYWSSRSDVIDPPGWAWPDPTHEPIPAERITVSSQRPFSCHGDLGRDRLGRWVCREDILFGELGVEICYGDYSYRRCERADERAVWWVTSDVDWCQYRFGPSSCNGEDDTWFGGGWGSGLDDQSHGTDLWGRGHDDSSFPDMNLWNDEEERSFFPGFPSSYDDPWGDESSRDRWP